MAREGRPLRYLQAEALHGWTSGPKPCARIDDGRLSDWLLVLDCATVSKRNSIDGTFTSGTLLRPLGT
jgi:hypothetical protein